MIYNNYKIPENITAEDEFMYTLINKFYCVGSHYGFVMGSFMGLIEHMKENNISNEIIEEAGAVYDFVKSHLNEYDNDIYEFIYKRWEEIGKPLSLSAHLAKKARLDKEDDCKSEYLDR